MRHGDGSCVSFIFEINDVIEQQLEGHIETFDPHEYIDRKLRLAENGIQNFLKVKKIKLD